MYREYPTNDLWPIVVISISLLHVHGVGSSCNIADTGMKIDHDHRAKHMRSWKLVPFTYAFVLKVEPYLINGSFLKHEYLKTELNEGSGTRAIAKVTSHRRMVNLSKKNYVEVMWHL